MISKIIKFKLYWILQTADYYLYEQKYQIQLFALIK
jgi:hypothetical protein